MNIVQAHHPYYYNCLRCGCELNVPGDVEKTEELRQRGVCEPCLAEMKQAFAEQRPVIFVKAPWDNAKVN